MLTRTLRALLLALVVAGASLVFAPAGPAAAAECEGDSGVTVVVDFGGSQVTGCAPGDPASGLEALRSAGFGYTFAPRDPGFVCTINGQPADRRCKDPNYWSYWHKSGGGGWSYSQLGAASYDPAPGSSQGWAFTGGRVAPNGAAPNGLKSDPKPTPKPTPQPQPKPKPQSRPQPKPARPAQPPSSSSPPAVTGGGTDPTAAAGSGGPVAKKKAAKLRRQARETASAGASAQAAGEKAVYTPEESAAPDPADQGSVPWWVGAGTVGVLGAASGTVWFLRRRGA